jgi:hypothetical protein
MASVKAQPEKRAVTAVAGAAPKVATHRGWYVLLSVMVLGFITASIVVQKGNWLTAEADQFLVDHLSERSFLSKVLSPHSHDAAQYQARELSHVLEFFDAQFIYWCVKHRSPHFYSIVTYVILALVSVLHVWYCSKYLRLDPAIGVLLVAVFWTTPCVFFSGQYFRNAKQGTALLLFLLVWHLIRTYQKSGGGPLNGGKKALLFLNTFVLSLALCWMDRQGYFLLAALILTLFAFAVGPKFPHWGLLLCGMSAGLVAHTIYGKFIGPGLIRNISGFQVSFEYQELPWDKLFKNSLTYLWHGVVLLINYFRYLFANLTGGLTLFAWAAMYWLFSQARLKSAQNGPGSPQRLEFKSFFGWVFLGWLGLLTGMNALMALRHEPMTWPDLRLFPHWLPVTLLALLATTFAVHALLKRFMLPAWVPRLMLAAFVISNLSTLPEHYRIFRTGHLQGYVAASPHLLKAIKDLYNSPPGNVPLKQKFDTAASARNAGDFTRILKNPLAQQNLTVDEFVFSSSFYNFLRSERNLEFKQP